MSNYIYRKHGVRGSAPRASAPIHGAYEQALGPIQNRRRTAAGMGSIGQAWDQYKVWIVVAGALGLGWWLFKDKGVSRNPEDAPSLDDADIVLGHIDDFAAEHPRSETKKVLDNVQRFFPGLAGRVEAARMRVL